MLLVAAVLVALALHRVVGQIGVLTWAVLVGMLVGNIGQVRTIAMPVSPMTTRLLRIGVALLGLSLSVSAIASLGPSVIVMIVAVLVSTMLVTTWLGRSIGVGPGRGVVIATGVSVGGASAIAAVQGTARADEDDVAAAIAVVTLYGSVAMIVLPLLQSPLGLSDVSAGIWAGSSIHEVGQVVAAGGAVGTAAVAVATVVKLTRVVLLAPLVAALQWLGRNEVIEPHTKRPPIVPLFVGGFVALVLVRSTGVLSPTWLDRISTVQTVCLACGMYGLGLGVHARTLVRNGGTTLVLGAAASLFISAVALIGVLVVR